MAIASPPKSLISVDAVRPKNAVAEVEIEDEVVDADLFRQSRHRDLVEIHPFEVATACCG